MLFHEALKTLNLKKGDLLCMYSEQVVQYEHVEEGMDILEKPQIESSGFYGEVQKLSKQGLLLKFEHGDPQVFNVPMNDRDEVHEFRDEQVVVIQRDNQNIFITTEAKFSANIVVWATAVGSKQIFPSVAYN